MLKFQVGIYSCPYFYELTIHDVYDDVSCVATGGAAGVVAAVRVRGLGDDQRAARPLRRLLVLEADPAPGRVQVERAAVPAGPVSTPSALALVNNEEKPIIVGCSNSAAGLG